MKFSGKRNEGWNAKEIGQEENNLEKKELMRMCTCIASGTS